MYFFDELKRRNVFRVGVAYVIVAWLTAQVTELALDSFAAPDWVIKTVLFLLIIGFPLALIFAWAFEVTPEGIKRDSEVDRDKSITRQSGRKLDFVIIGALVVALGYFVITRDSSPPREQSFDLAILDRPMVAVLPFANTSGDSAYDFLSLGLMDEIIVSLQRFRAFPVVSRGAALAFQGREKPITDIAAELQAMYVVDSTFRLNRENLRVLVTMSNRNGDQVWAQPFDLASDFKELYAMLDEVAAGIAGAVRDSEVTRVEASSRPPIAAWEHYIKGLSIILNWRPERYLEGRSHIEQALELDPNFAEAWWALGEIDSTELMVSSLIENVSLARLETIEGYFRRAHELSPFHGAACGCLGMILVALDRVDEAFVLLAEALKANPMSPALRVDYAQALLSQGRFDEARMMAESSARMEPVGIDLSVTWMIKAVADLGQDRREEARDNIFRAIYAHPPNVLVAPHAIVILYLLGDRDAAARLYEEFVGEFPGFSFENPFTEMILGPIDEVIASQRPANTELPPDALAILDELASQSLSPAN